MKYLYPAIFTPADEGGYTVEFPDLQGCITEGDTIEEAFEMAIDAMSGWILTSLEDKEQLPEASSIDNIEVEKGCLVNLVPTDLLEYRKKINSKSV